MGKKIMWGVLLLIAALVIAFFVRQYIRYKNNPNPDKTFMGPRVSQTVVNITEMTEEKTYLTLDMLVGNPLPFRFSADSLVYELYINDIQVGRSTAPEMLVIQAGDSNWVSLPVTIENKKLVKELKQEEKQNEDSADYRLKASFYARVFNKRKFSIDITRRLPLVYIPTVEVKGADIDSLRFTGALVNIRAAIANKNGFELKAKDITYDFRIEGYPSVKGNMDGITVIPAHGSTEIIIPAKLFFTSADNILFETLKKGQKINYTMNLDFIVDSELNMVNNSKATIHIKGTVKSLVKMIVK